MRSEAAVADRREPTQQEIPTLGSIALTPPTNDRDAPVAHAPHPWDRGTMIPGQWEPRQAPTVAAPQHRVRQARDNDSDRGVERRREPPTWLKVSFAAGALLGAMLLVMWAQGGAATCALSFEPPRHLQLSRLVDREHLAADSASAARAARRYTSGAAGSQQQQRFLECEDLLVSGIAATHGVSARQVRDSAGYAQ